MSSSISRNPTCLTGKNILRFTRLEVTDKCFRGNGLFRRMLRGPMGKEYGAATGKGEVYPEDHEVVEEEVDDGGVI